MGYNTGEGLILTQVQGATSFNSTNTARGNWKILNQGKSDHYAILRPGAFFVEWISPTHYVANYRTVVEIWQRYTVETTTHTNLYGYMAEALEAVIDTPRLGDSGGTILDSSVTGSEEPPQEMWTESGGPVWLKWEINVDWQEEKSI